MFVYFSVVVVYFLGETKKIFCLPQRHTKYHVGLEETDKHVQYFWNTLESFSQVVYVCVCVCVHACVCVCARVREPVCMCECV